MIMSIYFDSVWKIEFDEPEFIDMRDAAIFSSAIIGR
jgi:hypothetical protein